MKNISRKIRNAAIVAAMTVMNAPALLAQNEYKDFTTVLDDMTNEAGSWGKSLLNFVSVAVGIVGIAMLVWNYIKANKSDGGSNDSLISWGWRLLFVFGAMQLIKILVF